VLIMTDTMTSQNIDLSSWSTLYNLGMDRVENGADRIESLRRSRCLLAVA
jgi:hypothetical protein